MLSLFFLSLIVSTSAFKVTLCDCTKHLTGIGLLTFSDGDCEPATKIGKTRVEYRIMTDKKQLIIFLDLYVLDGFTKHITENFLGQLIIVPERIAIDTSAIQCDIICINNYAVVTMP
jgi:hypothetical protein